MSASSFKKVIVIASLAYSYVELVNSLSNSLSDNSILSYTFKVN